MWFHSLLPSWKSAHARRRQPPPAPRARLGVRQFEDRCLMSNYTAASVSALIADINAANAAGGANTIALTSSSLYRLTSQLPTIAANDNLTIVGNGDELGFGTSGFRMVDVAPGASLTLENLQVHGFSIRGGTGGAIYNQGDLTLSAVTLSGNSDGVTTGLGLGRISEGGAVWSSGSLTLENGTLFEGNDVRGVGRSGGPRYGNGYGGALYIAGGTANISDTTFTRNYAMGGVSSDGEPDGTAFGGAIYVAGGQVVISNASIHGNYEQGPGASGDVCYGGGMYVAGGTVTLTGDTVESNTANISSAGYGGGLYVAGGTVTLTSDTVESNTATYGGGLYIAAGTVTLSNTTVEANSATDYGGGIYIVSGATVYLDPFTVANTINNTDLSGTNGSTANIDGTYTLT